jgi:hypothetical protein
LLTDEKKWGPLVNTSNPLSSQGRIVSATAKLMMQMWAGVCCSNPLESPLFCLKLLVCAEGNVTHYAPRDMKKVVSDWAPQFEGYRQHDAQVLSLLPFGCFVSNVPVFVWFS